MSDELTVQYLTRVFREPGGLSQYSLEQVAVGIWFLIGGASPGELAYALIRPEMALPGRTECVRAMTTFFRDFVVQAAGPVYADRDPFHVACYMWWDIFPLRMEPENGEPLLHTECLRVMQEVVALPSELCQMSALHGLNHWQGHHPAEVERIVDTFLARVNASPRIRAYAARARRGTAQ